MSQRLLELVLYSFAELWRLRKWINKDIILSNHAFKVNDQETQLNDCWL